MSKFLKIAIEYEMEEEEMKKILAENNMEPTDFENEDEAYITSSPVHPMNNRM